MKKKLCSILALSMMLSSVANAARSDQSAELNQLIETCIAEGYSVDYEKAASSVFEQFISTEETDLANNNWTDQQKDYYQTGIDRIYSETKENLEGYLDGTKKPKGSVSFADNGKREVFNNIFTDGDGKPLISIGFGHDNTVFTDSDFLKNAGSNNIQTEIGPTHNIAYHTNVPLWKVLKNNNCDADVSVETAEGNNYLKIVNRVNAAENAHTYVLIRQIVPVKPNTNYLMSFDIKSESGGKIKFSPNAFSANFVEYIAGENWETKNVSARYTTAANQSYAEITIISDTIETICIDNIKFYDMKKSEVNILKNGDFEADGEYYFDIEALSTKLSAIENMAANGYSVDLLLSPHYMPDFMITKYPEISAPNMNLFLQYNIHHPIAKKFITDYLEFVMPYIAECDGIQSICLSNEANFYTSQIPDYYAPLFREYLKEKHGTDIGSLNTAYNLSEGIWGFGKTTYDSWDDVVMPTSVESSGLFYDYMHFNNEQLAAWHKMMADIVKDYVPEIPIHAKMQDYLYLGDSYSLNTMTRGTNVEMFDEFCDIAGNDAALFTYQPDSFYSTMMWYDMLSSLTGKPVYNSEEHLIADDNADFSDVQAQNVRFALINGVVHGRNASTLWRWHNESSQYGMFKQMPYTTYLTSKTMLDIQRLQDKYNAFYSEEKDTAFFYSEASRIMTKADKAYEKALLESYKAVSALGHKTGFVTELHPEKINDYKTLILSGVSHIPEDSIDAIASYMKNGGKVFIESSSLAYDEYGVSKTSDNRTYILNNAISVSAGTVAGYYNAYNSVGDIPLTVSDSNGDIISGIDVKVADYEGEKLIHMVSMDGSTKAVALSGKWTDLISNTEYTDTVTLTAYEPVLLIPIEAIDEPEEPVLGNNFSFDGVISSKEASYDVEYILENGTKTRVVVIAYGNDGQKLGFAYTEKTARANVVNSFSGQLLYEGITALELIVLDVETESIIHRETI